MVYVIIGIKNARSSNIKLVYDLPTLYIVLLHIVMKAKLAEFIEHNFNIKGSLYLALGKKYII